LEDKAVATVMSRHTMRVTVPELLNQRIPYVSLSAYGLSWTKRFPVVRRLELR